jgi:hypothetical protein
MWPESSYRDRRGRRLTSKEDCEGRCEEGTEGTTGCSCGSCPGSVREYRTLAEKQPLTLQGSDYAHAVLELNKAIDRAEGLVE